jgi:hypothetical protein
VRRGHLLYVHAADGREHYHGPAAIAVQGDPEVQLVRDVGRALDVDLRDAQSFYVHAQDCRGCGLRFRGRLRDLDPAGLPASADVHLCFHGDRRRDRLRRGLGLLG